nr:leucine-rich repeat extensin-like protein 5 [Lepeophtheirus salmonis]
MNPSPSANSMPTTTDPEQANTPPPSSSSSPGAHPPFTFPTPTQPRRSDREGLSIRKSSISSEDIPSTPSTPVSSPKPTPPHTPPIQRHSRTELQNLPPSHPSIRREVGVPSQHLSQPYLWVRVQVKFKESRPC